MIGHSMGGRVTVSTLASLYKNKEWKSENFKLASVEDCKAGLLYGISYDDSNNI